ncbi:MAG: FAD-dependent oxidoreductase [Bacteroidales bacterium]|nr:FAD-dependent oxidoreductase [Bacteroidales bacterium]MDD3521327.1 FAD-dependent oxidoreductase [Bacteroidales bacterium]MDD4030609.1 FAD-dependent oxidoreductase [Bacteroidales bacterium]MDD4434702.1 FAD-dependent oxidoreductase [Bacteroidales bacterium]MDD5732186.1 FAD-dependent oxidoreductase [Bacteroidales bacterium]
MKNYDVIVVGAGPAGLCASVAAARQGARVALIERYGILGGNLTAGYVGPILGSVSKGTMRDEVCTLLGVRDNDWIGEKGYAHNFEEAKLALAEWIATEKGIDVYLQTSIFDVVRNGNKVEGIICASNEGPLHFKAPVTVDCTGDGIVAFLAGAQVEKGREDGLMQPVTLEFTIDGVDEKSALICIGDVDDVKLGKVRFLDWCKSMADLGKIPQKIAAVRLHPCTEKGRRQVNTTQVNGVDITHVEEIFPADLELRQQIRLLTGFLRENVPGYQDIRFIGSGCTTGVRESRRVVGDYMIDAGELASGCRFKDVIVHNALFIVDIHNPEGAGQADEKIQYCKPYDLPYRCFLPKGIEGLMVAGRCISGTHRAHASYRVMSICMAMGEAVGIAAAMSAQSDCTPRELDVNALQGVMSRIGIELFD